MTDGNPPATDARPTATGVTPPGAPESPAGDATRQRVLVVDDQRAVRLLIGACLREAGFAPALAACGEAALAEAREAARTDRPFSVAVVDLTLPGGPSGHEIATSLRRIDPKLPIVAISGYSELAISTRGGSSFCAFLAKPFTPDELEAAVLRCARAPAPPTIEE